MNTTVSNDLVLDARKIVSNMKTLVVAFRLIHISAFASVVHLAVQVEAQELEVRSFNHPYSLKTKCSLCHYVVMTRSETKFQAPLNRRNQDIFGEQ